MAVECEKCGKKYGSKKALQQHMDDYDHSKISTCQSCGEKFTSQDKFNKHRRTHMNPFTKALSGMSTTHVVVAFFVVLLAGGLVYAGDIQTGSRGGSSAGESVEVNKTVEVSGSEYFFTPRTISVEKGEKVKVEFRNTGGVPHNLRIPGLNVGTSALAAGQSSSFIFTAPKSGEFPLRFECTLPGHAEQGMVGKVKHIEG